MAGLNSTPSSERCTIGIFGKTNAGKSTLFNEIIKQDKAVVSEKEGTTTDPVQKAMEILPLGPVTIIDTPGLQDKSTLGETRKKKTREVLRRVDIALIVIDCMDLNHLEPERELVRELALRQVPMAVIISKIDLAGEDLTITDTEISRRLNQDVACITYSAKDPRLGISARNIIEVIAPLKRFKGERKIIGDRVKACDNVILVIPIDASAPKGRLILPQVLVLRELLDAHASGICVQPSELEDVLDSLKEPPALVITDSQAFKEVGNILPEEIPLTSFSVLMAAYKGNLKTQMEGARAASMLKDGSTVLIAEGCTHHRQCNDIGSIQIPKLINKLSGKKLNFEFTSGGEFPDKLDYDLIVHCGGCMLNAREMSYRIKRAMDRQVPITNYGILIAYANGILDRAVKIFNLNN